MSIKSIKFTKVILGSSRWTLCHSAYIKAPTIILVISKLSVISKLKTPVMTLKNLQESLKLEPGLNFHEVLREIMSNS